MPSDGSRLGADTLRVSSFGGAERVALFSGPRGSRRGAPRVGTLGALVGAGTLLLLLALATKMGGDGSRQAIDGAGQSSRAIHTHLVEHRQESMAKVDSDYEQSNSTDAAIYDSESFNSADEEKDKVLDADAYDVTAAELADEVKALVVAWRKGGGSAPDAPWPGGKIEELRRACRDAVKSRYGDLLDAQERLVIEMELEFPPSIRAEGHGSETAKLWIRSAPLSWLPHGIWIFLHNAVDAREGFFHRRAKHVLQAFLRPEKRGLSFQEYDSRFPHEANTLGFAGRPGGPAFYISIKNNTRDYGPGSQGSATEADGIFGKLVESGARGATTAATVERMKEQPGGSPDLGFVKESENWIRIKSTRVVYSDGH